MMMSLPLAIPFALFGVALVVMLMRPPASMRAQWLREAEEERARRGEEPRS